MSLVEEDPLESIRSKLLLLGQFTAKLSTGNLSVLALGEISAKAFTFIAFVHLARVLEPSGFGLLEFALALTMILTLVVDQGLATLGVREVAREPKDTGRLVGTIISTQLQIALVLVVGLVLLVILFQIEPPLSLLLIGFAVSLALFPFFITWYFQGRRRMFWVAFPQVIRWSIFAAAALLLVHSPAQLIRVPLIEIAALGTAGILLILVYLKSGNSSLHLRFGLDRNLVSESLPIGGAQLIWALRMYFPVVLLGLTAGETAVGFFGAPHRIIMAIQTILGAYFLNLLPVMSREYRASPEKLSDLLSHSLWLTGSVSVFLLAVPVTLASFWIVDSVFGPEYGKSPSVAVLSILIWLIPILVWRRHCFTALISSGNQKVEWACSVIGLLSLIALLIPFSRLAGPVGAAWAIVISEFLAAAIAWRRIRFLLPQTCVNPS